MRLQRWRMRTKDRTTRNNYSREWHEEEEWPKQETTEVQRTWDQHIGCEGESAAKWRVSTTEENSGRTRSKNRWRDWGVKSSHDLPRTSFKTWWEAEASLQGLEEGVNGEGVEITDINNFGIRVGGSCELEYKSSKEGSLGIERSWGGGQGEIIASEGGKTKDTGDKSYSSQDEFRQDMEEVGSRTWVKHLGRKKRQNW